MSRQISRSRLITVPEAWATGCQTWNAKTCPKYMYNYLKTADGCGTTVAGTEISYDYWTMNARLDWFIDVWNAGPLEVLIAM